MRNDDGPAGNERASVNRMLYRPARVKQNPELVRERTLSFQLNGTIVLYIRKTDLLAVQLVPAKSIPARGHGAAVAFPYLTGKLLALTEIRRGKDAMTMQGLHSANYRPARTSSPRSRRPRLASNPRRSLASANRRGRRRPSSFAHISSIRAGGNAGPFIMPSPGKSSLLGSGRWPQQVFFFLAALDNTHGARVEAPSECKRLFHRTGKPGLELILARQFPPPDAPASSAGAVLLVAGGSLIGLSRHLDHRVGKRKVIPSRPPKPWGPVSGELAQ